jgi:hypothetical protein
MIAPHFLQFTDTLDDLRARVSAGRPAPRARVVPLPPPPPEAVPLPPRAWDADRVNAFLERVAAHNNG